LAGDSSFLFVKPVKDENVVKNEIRAYKLAVDMGLSDYLLPLCSVKMQKSDFALVTPLLSLDAISLDKFEKNRPGAGDGLVKSLIESGEAHKLALFDYLIMNADRHRNNIFVNNGKLVLIDQGESFKKKDHGFVPGYLRLKDFKITKKMPLTKHYNELRQYIHNLNVSDKELQKEIDNIKSSTERMDVVINHLWEPFIQKD
jgi:hypothetical protein